jgi:hypothetical protein
MLLCEHGRCSLPVDRRSRRSPKLPATPSVMRASLVAKSSDLCSTPASFETRTGPADSHLHHKIIIRYEARYDAKYEHASLKET